MEPGKKPATEPTEQTLEFITGQIGACFQPSGSVEVHPIMGLLSLAKRRGFDPKTVYETAPQNLPPYKEKFAPPYERVAPKE